MYQLKNQDDDDDDVEDDDDDELLLFVPIMNTPHITNTEVEEAQGFLTLSEALSYDLTMYNFDLVGLLVMSTALPRPEDVGEQQQYFHHTSEEIILECNPEAIVDNDDPDEKQHYDRMYRVIQCINFCRHYVKHEKNDKNAVESKNDLNNSHIMDYDESYRFNFGKRTSDAYISFWTQQNQRCCDDDEAFLFHHPVLENDAYLFHVEDILNLCSNSMK